MEPVYLVKNLMMKYTVNLNILVSKQGEWSMQGDVMSPNQRNLSFWFLTVQVRDP